MKPSELAIGESQVYNHTSGRTATFTRDSENQVTFELDFPGVYSYTKEYTVADADQADICVLACTSWSEPE